MRRKIPFSVFFEFGVMTVTQELPGKGRKLQPLRFVSFIHCFAWKRSADSFTGCTVSCLLVWEHKQPVCHFPHCMGWQCFVLWTRFTQVFLKLSWQFGRMLSIFGFPWPLIPFTYLLYSKVVSKGKHSSEDKNKTDKWLREASKSLRWAIFLKS